MEPIKNTEETKKKATTKKVASSSKTSSTKKATSKTTSKTTKKAPTKTASKKATTTEAKKKSPVKKEVKEVVENVVVEEKVQVKNELNDLMKLLDSKKSSQKVNKPSGSLDEQEFNHKEILKKKMDAQKKLNEKNLDEKQSPLPKPLPRLEDIMGSDDLEEELVNEELENLRKENERLNAEVKNLTEDISMKEEKILVLTNSIVGKNNELELSRELEELKKQNELLKEELDKKNDTNNPVNDLQIVNTDAKDSEVKEQENDLNTDNKESLLEDKDQDLVSNKDININVSYDDKGELALRLRLLNDRIAEKERQITLVENELNKLSEKDIVAESFTVKIKEVRKVRNEYVKQANNELEELAKLVKNNEEKVSAKKTAYDEKCKELDAFEKEFKSSQYSYLEKQEKIKVRTKLNAEKDSLFVIVEQAEESYKKLLIRYKNSLKQVELRIQKLNDAESEIINLYLNQLRMTKTQENTDYLVQKEERNNLIAELETLSKKIHGEDKNESNVFETYDLNNLKNQYAKVLGKLHLISTKIKEREKVEKVLIDNEKVVKDYYEAFKKREIAIFNIYENTSKLEILQSNSQSDNTNYLEKIKILIEDDKGKVDYYTKIIEKVKEDEKVIFFISLVNSIEELQEALKEYKRKEQSLKNIIDGLGK